MPPPLTRTSAAAAALVACLGAVVGCADEPPFDAPFPGPCEYERRYASGNEVVTRIRYEYDASGRLARVEYDGFGAFGPDRDGVVDDVRHFVYDDASRLIRVETTDASGTETRRVSLSYDGLGNLATWERDRERSDEQWDERCAYTYDTDGRIAVESYYADPLGSVDGVWYYTYADSGAVTTMSWHPDDQLQADSRVACRYDGHGRLVEETCELDCKGDEHATYEYDSRGLLASVRTYPADPFESTEEYRYDRAGNLLSIETYDDAGKLVVIETYDYDCWDEVGDDPGLQRLPVVVGRLEFDYILYGPCSRRYSELAPQLPW